MIRDDHELHRTQEQVVRFENALLSLRQKTFERDPQGFRLTAAAYADEIATLRASIDEYIGLKAVRDDSPALVGQ
jgi:hypothetical protein